MNNPTGWHRLTPARPLAILLAVWFATIAGKSHAADTVVKNGHVLSVSGRDIMLDGSPIKLIGLRCSNALISEEKAAELVANLDVFKSYGINTITVYFMGSRFGNIKG